MMNPDAKLDTEREAQRQVTLHRKYDEMVRTAVSICESFLNCSDPPMSNPSPKIGLHALMFWAKKEQKKTRKGTPKYKALQGLYDTCKLHIERDFAEPIVYKVNRSEFLRKLAGKPLTKGERPEGEHKTRLKPPCDEARQAYQLYHGVGLTQQIVADKMNETLKRDDITQGQVSKWIKQYKKWRVAEELPVENAIKGGVEIEDPKKLDMGKREDSLAIRQRPQKADDDDNDNN